MHNIFLKPSRISIVLLFLLIRVDLILYAQYSLPPKIKYFLSEKEDFRKNEELRSDGFKREGQFKKALNEEQFFRDKAKDLKLTYENKEYNSQNLTSLIDTLFIDFISHQNKNRYKTTLDSLISIVENNKGMQEIFEKINTLQNFYGNYYFMDDTLFHRYGPGSYSFRDTTFDLLEPGNYGFNATDSTFIQPRLNEISDINVIIAAYIITGNQFWQKTDNSCFFDDYIEKTFSYVDSNFRVKDISKKIDAYILIGDLCMKIGEAFYPLEYFINNPIALEAYLKALNLAKINDLSAESGLIEFKISNFYNPKWHNDIVDKSLYHLNEAIKYYQKDDELYKSELHSLMFAKGVNLECMKVFRDGLMGQSEIEKTIANIFNNRTLCESNSIEIKYYYYQALGYYFSRTGLKSDLEIANAYFQAALYYAFQNNEKNEKIAPQIKASINYLFWIYGNLNLELKTINLYDLVLEYAEAKHDVEYLKELFFLESYMWYNLANFEKAQVCFSHADTILNYNYLSYNPKVEEIKSLLAGNNSIQDYKEGAFSSGSKNLDIKFKFHNFLEEKVFTELSTLNTLEYKYQIQLLDKTILKVEREKKNIRTYSIIAIIILCILGLGSAIIIVFTNLKIRRLKNLKFTSDKKAALSQVLARCMSHNIGSHALSNFMDERDEELFNLNYYQCNYLPLYMGVCRKM